VRNVFVVGVGQTCFGKFLERNIRSLSEEALRLAIDDCGIDCDQIDIVYFANALSGLITGQETIRGQVALRHSPLMGKPIINIDNACSSGSSAFQLAWLSVASGQADVTLALGAEKLTHADKAITFSAYASGVDVEEREEMRHERPMDRSLFMDLYAERTRKYMARSGATAEDFARVTVKSRHAGSLNPKAQFREEMTVEEVLGSRMISAPLTLPMCSPIGDGAAAAILVTEYVARSLSVPPVRVLASATVSANADGAEPAAAFRAAQKAYALAGLGPRDVHVAEVHDASASAEIMLYEHLGFADRNRGFHLIRDGVTAIGGLLPVNSGGGLLSRGHPVGATGVAQLVELTTQLRGRAGQRQRPNARVALAECSGGQIGADSAVATVTILAT
jgi:acetyl-CoA acetyltransferase